MSWKAVNTFYRPNETANDLLKRLQNESLFELKYKAFESRPQYGVFPEIRNDQTWEYLSKDDNGNKYHLHHYLRYWNIHKKEIRDIKINDILSK